MILGQLIQAGRRFCECRSHDFIPESDERVVLIAYTVEDKFLAQSMDAYDLDLSEQIRVYLEEIEAIAYILVKRHLKNLQDELPAPVGRERMDRITITAATEDSLLSITHLMQPLPSTDGYKLITKAPVANPNLFHRQGIPSFGQQRVSETALLDALFE